MRYSTGLLAGFELQRYRYLVLVSQDHVPPPQDELDGGFTYRYINIAIRPEARRERRARVAEVVSTRHDFAFDGNEVPCRSTGIALHHQTSRPTLSSQSFGLMVWVSMRQWSAFSPITKCAGTKSLKTGISCLGKLSWVVDSRSIFQLKPKGIVRIITGGRYDCKE